MNKNSKQGDFKMLFLYSDIINGEGTLYTLIKEKFKYVPIGFINMRLKELPNEITSIYEIE